MLNNCKKEQKSSYKKIEFGSKLKELGIEYYKTAGNNKYKVSTEFLHDLATTRHWIHEIDDYCEEQPSKEEQGSKQDDELIQKYTQSEKDLKKLKNENEQLRLELEALKKAKKEETIVRVIEDSDDECEPPPPPPKQIESDKLKEELEAMKDKLRKMKSERSEYYGKWFHNLSEKEQGEENIRASKTEKQLKEEEFARAESLLKRQFAAKGIPVKSVLSIIDDSDDEEEGEEKSITVRIKDNKIMKALECDCDFID